MHGDRRAVSVLARALCLATLTGGVASCGSRVEGGPVSLGESDAGRRVTVAAGEEVLITLPSNRSSGYRWVVRDSATPTLRSEGEAEYAQDSTRNRMTGVPGAETFRFTAVEPGQGTLRLEYVRPWESGVAPSRVFRVGISVR